MVKFFNKCIFFLLIPCLLLGVEGDPFILFTVPKSGSYLSVKFLKALTKTKEQISGNLKNENYNFYKKRFSNGTFTFMHYHNQFDPKAFKAIYTDVVPIVNVRDPRDVVVSSVFYFRSSLDRLLGKSAPFDERLSFTIQYTDSNSYFGPYYFFTKAIELIDTIQPMVLRFEDLTGPQGGGTFEAQMNTIYNTAARLSIPMTEEKAVEIATGLFGSSPTFREGQIGSWRKHFTEEHIQQFKASKLQEVLVRLGYEADDNW